MIPKLFTPQQAAEALNLSVSAIYEEIAAGAIDVHRLGPQKGAIRITEAAILAYLAARLCAAEAQSEELQTPPVATGAPTLRPVPKSSPMADLDLLALAERGKRVKRSVRG